MPKQLNQKQCDALHLFGFHRCAKSLYLQIRPHGSRSWLFRYSRNDRAHWLGLGPAELVTQAVARKAVLALRLAFSTVATFPTRSGPGKLTAANMPRPLQNAA
jgi:hypothetical protein